MILLVGRVSMTVLPVGVITAQGPPGTDPIGTWKVMTSLDPLAGVLNGGGGGMCIASLPPLIEGGEVGSCGRSY